MDAPVRNEPIRDRIGALLRTNKWIIAVEISVASALCFARTFPFSIQLFLLGFGSLSLWLRRLSWGDVGLRKAKSWWKVALWGLVAACVMALVVNLLIGPIISRLVGRPPSNARFDNIRGHLTVLLEWLSAVWTIVAFGEEMTFRGYLMNRIADLAGRTRAGWTVALLGCSLIFGLGHAYQGVAGVINTAEVGLLLGILYLACKRNLLVNIVCHGAFDSISLIALYFS
jgi:membrane protease YdiL (CAAX protease family)